MKWFIVALAVMFCVGESSASAAADPVAVETVQARFIQEKQMAILAQPLISTGILLFAAPQSLRWEYRTPVRSILLLHDGKLRKFIERDGELVADRGMRPDAMQMMLEHINNWLNGSFTDNELFAVVAEEENRVVLQPRQEALAGMIEAVEIELGDRAGLIDSITLQEGGGSSTVMRFSDRVINQEIDKTRFTRP